MLPETRIGRRLLLRTALRIDAVPLRRLQASSAVDACVGKAFNWSSNPQASAHSGVKVCQVYDSRR